jgi:DNA-binding response OmpR family regulator
VSEGAPLILIVEDEPAIRESLGFALERQGFQVALAETLAEARAHAPQAALILLDLMLPDGNGLDFLRRLRKSSDVPTIVLTSRDEEADRVLGLELGADDYVVKPFSPREVAARVRAVLRRARPPEEAPEGGPEGAQGGAAVASGTAPLVGPLGLRLDPRSRRASVGEGAAEHRGPVELSLSRTEFDLLAALLREPGRVFERQDLLERVWGQDVVVGERTVDVHVKALRRKLDEAAEAGALVETVRGVGYRLREG